MRYVAHAVSHRESEGTVQEFLDSEDDAVLPVDAQGNVRYQSAASRKLLRLAIQSPGENHEVMTAEIGSMPIELQRLVERLRSVLSGRNVSLPSLLVSNRWGRFVLCAYFMAEEPGARDALIAIRIQRQEPMLVRFVVALNKLDLSPQQGAVAVRLAKGASNRELAVTMGMSVNTVSYHIKQLFRNSRPTIASTWLPRCSQTLAGTRSRGQRQGPECFGVRTSRVADACCNRPGRAVMMASEMSRIKHETANRVPRLGGQQCLVPVS
jgi:hypothetical protein